MPTVPTSDPPPKPIGICATPYCRNPAYVTAELDGRPICYDCLEELEWLRTWKEKQAKANHKDDDKEKDSDNRN